VIAERISMEDTRNDRLNRRGERRVYLFAGVGLAVFAMATFGDVLLMQGDRVISSRIGDGSQYFSRMRDFGFTELAKGNIPLWNPHIFAGTPFVGNFQSAIFYPVNFMYVLMPLPAAMNLDITIHVFLTSFFMFCWARFRGLHPLACMVAGIVLAYGAAYFLRVLAGHFTMLAALCWSPLIFLAVDRVFRRPSVGWTLVGVAATTMQVLAGHPQSLFMTALAVGLYCIFRLAGAEERKKVVGCLAVIAVFPLFLGAVQLLTGLQVSQESMRMGGVSYDFATTFSFHPENLLTLLAPTLFGDTVHIMYWARWAYWDSTVFLSISGLSLALYGAFHGTGNNRCIMAGLALFFGFIALGRYTPVYQALYSIVPGLDSFRSPSKFMFSATLFIAMLSGMGLDTLLRGSRRSLVVVSGLAGLGVCLLASGTWVYATSVGAAGESPMERTIKVHSELEDTFFDFDTLPAAYYEQAATFASTGLFLAALTCGLLVPMFWFGGTKRIAAYGIACILLVELFVSARYSRDTFRLSDNNRPVLESLYDRLSSEARTLDVAGVNNAMRNHGISERRDVVWGYDPVVLDRYAEYVIFAAGNRHFDDEIRRFALWGNDPVTQGIHGPENFLTFTKTEPIQDFGLFTLLRTGLLVVNPGIFDAASGYLGIADPAPRFFLASDYQVYADKDGMFAALGDTSIDLRETVLLESAPVPEPENDGGADELVGVEFTIVEQSTDHVVVEVEIPRASLLVMTDAYSPNWRATGLEGSVQEVYEVLPAYWALRCIPVGAGLHRIRFEYAPTAYRVGLWISCISALLFVVFVIATLLQVKTVAHDKI